MNMINMVLYIQILRLLGLKGAFGSNPLDDDDDIHLPTVRVTVSHNDDQNRVHIKEDAQNLSWFHKFCYLPLNTIYLLFIIITLSWTTIYAIYKAIEYTELTFITLNIFEFYFLIQYIFGILYYKTDHFNKMVRKFSEIKKIMNICFVLSIIISMTLVVTMIILMNVGVYMNIYSEMYKDTTLVSKIIITIIIIITKFYSYCIFLSNAIIFSATFIIHCQDIINYVDKLTIFIESHGESIRSIISEFKYIKSQYKISVKNLNNMFSSTLICGFLFAYSIIINYDSVFMTPFNYVLIVCIFINIVIYLYVIVKIKKSVAIIKDVTSSENFDTNFLEKKDFVELIAENSNIGSFEEDDDEENIRSTIRTASKIETDDQLLTLKSIKGLCMRSMIKNLENSNTNDYQVLSNQLSQQWTPFNIFGFKIDDATIISKLIGICTLFYTGVGIGSKFDFTK
jgi:hypothetical protein